MHLRRRLPRLLIMMLSLAVAAAHAAPASALLEELDAKWTCSMTVTLVGQPNHFVLYGRDSWDGTATLYCALGRQALARVMRVTYNTYDQGYGADAGSKLTATIALSTAVHPDQFMMRAIVTNVDPTESVRWPFASSLSQGAVLIADAKGREVLRSLQKGTVFIRGALP